MSVLLKPSIQKTHTLYLLFSFPFGLFVNKKEKAQCGGEGAVYLKLNLFFFLKLNFFLIKKCKLQGEKNGVQLAQLVMMSVFLTPPKRKSKINSADEKKALYFFSPFHPFLMLLQ